MVKRAAQAELGQHVQDMLKGRPIDLADAKIAARQALLPTFAKPGYESSSRISIRR